MLTVVLDSGPAGLVTSPLARPEAQQCNLWMQQLRRQGVRFVLPEIVDYELRRELVRAGKLAGLRRLDALGQAVTYLPITTWTMRKAAEFWADARKRGKPTASEHALDGDVILAAQATECESMDPRITVVVATGNPKHLDQFVDARNWFDVTMPAS